jgi:hypothetical protein
VAYSVCRELLMLVSIRTGTIPFRVVRSGALLRCLTSQCSEALSCGSGSLGHPIGAAERGSRGRLFVAWPSAEGLLILRFLLFMGHFVHRSHIRRRCRWSCRPAVDRAACDLLRVPVVARVPLAGRTSQPGFARSVVTAQSHGSRSFRGLPGSGDVEARSGRALSGARHEVVFLIC